MSISSASQKSPVILVLNYLFASSDQASSVSTVVIPVSVSKSVGLSTNVATITIGATIQKATLNLKAV